MVMKIIVQLSGLLAESLQISYIRLTAGNSLDWSGSGQGLREHHVYRWSGHRGSPASLPASLTLWHLPFSRTSRLVSTL